MGLFGGPAKQEPVSSAPYEGDMFEEPFDALPTLPKAQDNTVIAKGITFTGTIHGEGSVRVEGCLEGEVNLKGYVIITATGRVKGPVEADVIRIAGQVEGNLVSHDHVRYHGQYYRP